jgi:Outer membrane protein beta-barrel domain
MKIIFLLAAFVGAAATPLLAQTDRGYVAASGGFAVSTDTTSGNALGEVGVRVAPHIVVFGDVGQFHDVQPSAVQPAIDATTSFLSQSAGLTVTGTGRVPALYSVGGVRYELPRQSRFAPYVLGGIGVARMSPTAEFSYASGPLPDGSTPSVGDDVTSQIVAAGDFTAPTATTAFMYTLGGGVDVPVTRSWSVDAGYRFSRINSDTPVNVQGVNFGLGYRF